jgi:chemotaxis protein methyltransferase WspC
MMSDAEQGVLAVLEQTIGLDWRSVGKATVLAAVAGRCTACGLSMTKYAQLVSRDGPERQALINDVVVAETWFMRDSAPFLNLVAFAKKIALGAVPKIRILSMPCATGEEPYSVAMSLLGAGLASSQFHIDAVDVCDRSIGIARRGAYRAISFRGNDLRYRERFFDAGDRSEGNAETWQIRPEVQTSVQFHCANALGPGFMPAAPPYHIVLCRNLIIYLTQQARQQLLDLLLKKMHAESIFIAGHAENVEMMDPRFCSLAVPHAFTFVKGPSTKSPSQLSGLLEKPRRPEELALPKLQGLAAALATRRTPLVAGPRLPSPDPPSSVPALRADSTRISGIEDATALADRGELVAAEEVCDQYLQQNATDSTGWVLLGTIQSARKNLSAAERSFARAIYCDPTCYRALMQLAGLLERRGDPTGAANMRRRAAKTSEPAR